MKRVYISGKISGKKLEDASADFEEREKILRAKGYEPVNPFRESYKFFGTYDAPYEEIIDYDLKLLATCDAICFLDDWQDSKGAKREAAEALRLGIETAKI